MTSDGETSGAAKVLGDATAALAVANAHGLGVIWFRMIWSPAEGWHAYDNPYGGSDRCGWHTTHVHMSVN